MPAILRYNTLNFALLQLHIESNDDGTSMPLNLACLGVLGGHGRVRVGEKRLAVAVEPILRRTQWANFVVFDLAMKSALASLWRRDAASRHQAYGNCKGTTRVHPLIVAPVCSH